MKDPLIETADGSLTVQSHAYGEEFHSRGGAALETEMLYMGASGYQDRLARKQALTVLDVGLGLGYNALWALNHWLTHEHPGNLKIVSLEKDASLVQALRHQTAPWTTHWQDSIKNLATHLVQSGPDFEAQWSHPSSLQTASWQVRVGDACERAWEPVEGVDIIWQDAFSPRVNPELWTLAWFSRLRKVVNPQGVLVTYSVAGSVRRALAEAGFDWEKIPAAGEKKAWLRARPREVGNE